MPQQQQRCNSSVATTTALQRQRCGNINVASCSDSAAATAATAPRQQQRCEL
jgi:hypothetical protein